MGCFYPKLCFQNTKSKQRIKWTGKNYYADSFLGVPSIFKSPEWKALKVPCGGCMDCRLKKSREMAIRCVHEAKLHGAQNMFLTLTYDPKSLPKNSTFNFNHPKSFLKSLRNHLCIQSNCKKLTPSKNNPKTLHFSCTGLCPKIKSYGCAEYGENGTTRPHYHLLIFGYKSPDLKPAPIRSRNQRMKCKYFVSDEIKKLWPYGFHVIGDLTFQSAAYCARYVMKKTKDKTELQKELGRFHEKSICVSRRPGLGLEYLKKYYLDFYPADKVTLYTKDGQTKRYPVPSYYDRKASELGLIDLEAIKAERQKRSEKDKINQTQDRLMVKEEILESRIKQLVRRYENET